MKKNNRIVEVEREKPKNSRGLPFISKEQRERMAIRGIVTIYPDEHGRFVGTVGSNSGAMHYSAFQEPGYVAGYRI